MSLELGKKQESQSLSLQLCPVCGSVTRMVHLMKNEQDEKSMWYHCLCGIIFQDRYPLDGTEQKAIYKKDYVDGYLGLGQKHIDASQYPVRLYGPIIEELTYGRKMLEVGFCTTFLMQAFKERGWLAWGLDCHRPILSSVLALIEAQLVAWPIK